MNEKQLLELAREQFAEAYEAESKQRAEAQEDLRIFDGSGIWPERLRMAREGDPKGARPCLVISDLAARVHQIANDFRQNRPGIKVRPVDDKADKDTAEVLNGVIRHIEQHSMADIAYETANFSQVVSGIGYFRLLEEIVDGEAELCVKPIEDPNTVYLDPYSDPIGSTAQWAFVTTMLPRAQVEREFPGVELESWDGGEDDQWVNEDSVRIAEWFRIEDRSKNRITTDDGEMGEDEYWDKAKASGTKPAVRGTRMDRKKVVVWRKLLGNKVRKTVELPISYIPVFRMVGETYVMDGRKVYKGLVRDSRDAVRMVSYNFSKYTEAVALQPVAPFVGAAGQFDGFEAQWAGANSENFAYLEYNNIDLNGKDVPPPQRSAPPMAAQGLIQGLVLAKDALKDTSGMGPASLGQQGNEKSGKAILARQREGDVGSFHYHDNAAKAMRHCGRVLIQWIPHVYDERDVIRIMGEDGDISTARLDWTQKQAVRRVQTPQGVKSIYNPSIGKYDVIAAVGPSYSTKRVEMVEMMSDLFQANPALVQVLGDIFIANQDIPGADKMAQRLKAMLPPQVLATEEQGDQAIPPEIMVQMQQKDQQLNEAKQLLAMAQQRVDELESTKDADYARLEVDMFKADADFRKAELASRTQLAIAAQNNEVKALIAGFQQQAAELARQQKATEYQINTLLAMQQQASAEEQFEHQKGMDQFNAGQSAQQQEFSQQMALNPPPDPSPAGE